MAPVVVKCVVSYSSQDPVHKLDNLLTAQGGNWKRWLCASDDRSGVMEAELQLDRAYHIGYVDIGNCGSAYMELLVGRSSWPRSREYVTLLPATMFMNPMESRAGKNKMVVRMFNESLLSEEGRSEMWDRVRIICRQPFRKDLQFGLSFLRLRTPDTEVPGSPTSRVEACGTETNEAIESTKSRLLKLAGTSEDGTSEHLGRSARMFEVLKFLGSLDFSKMDVDTVMYSDLKMQYKQVLGRKLTAEEKRVFFQTTQQYLEQYFSQNKDSENRQQSNGHSTTSPEKVETAATESVTVLKDTSSKTNTPQNTRKRGGKGKQPRLQMPVTPTTISTVEVNNANQTNTPQSTRKRGGKGKQPMLPTPVTTTTSTVQVNNADQTNTPQSTRKRGGKGKQPMLPMPVTTTTTSTVEVEVNNANQTNTPQNTRKRGGNGKQPWFPTPLKTSSTVEVNNADSALTGRQLRASFLASVVDRRGGNQPCEQVDVTAEASCSRPTPKKRGRRAASAAGSAKKRPKRCNRSMYPVGDTHVEEDEPSCSQSSCGSTGASDTLAECPICEGKYPSYIIEAHASECTGDSPDDDLPSPSKPCGSERDDYYTPPRRLVACPLCALRFPPSVIQDHANACADRDVICVF
ncbi:xrcc1 N terminal domain [Branchiostoma belcheri]|nr:xrcc1 N terminal domain [Branchiostoma belcheri]